jgi:hypothetical protein
MNTIVLYYTNVKKTPVLLHALRLPCQGIESTLTLPQKVWTVAIAFGSFVLSDKDPDTAALDHIVFESTPKKRKSSLNQEH